MNTTNLTCRFCSAALEHTFVDLGMSPMANAYITGEQLARPEVFYPLHTYVCERCFLVQLPEVASPESIFSDYAYFSSYSDTWLNHAKSFAEMARERFQLGPTSRVVEVASNDGYLLRYFRDLGISVLGIEPAKNVAQAAEKLGIPTRVEFFGSEMARRLVAEKQQADLLVGNNVFAHTPYLNDFAAGLAIALAPAGTLSLEFPHLLRLMGQNQFDTIYHEHFSYFSFTTARKILAHHGLEVFDVEELTTHGGSLRLLARHQATHSEVSERVKTLLAQEEASGLLTLGPYRAFGEQVKSIKRGLLEFLVREKADGKQIVGYGAPAKGNTLLNYCGVRSDFLDYTVDRSPHKQGHYLPGTHIPIFGPERIRLTKPDYVLILPWNLRQEIAEQMSDIRTWGGQFLVAIPRLEVIP
jgi:hypothetical protein